MMKCSVDDRLHVVEPWQQLVIDEKRALDLRITSLASDIACRSLQAEELNRLRRQLVNMQGYSQALADRISVF
jgi:hypothetical protein